MESLYFLIPISFLFVVLAIALYFWAVKAGQYDDLDIEGQRILFERDTPNREPKPTDTTPSAEDKP